MSQTGQLKIEFSKPMLINNLRLLTSIEETIKEAISVEIINGDLNEEDDKSILDVRKVGSDETSLTLQIDFNNAGSISQDISEPDELKVSFDLPSLFVDAQTGEPLDTASIE